MDIMVDDGTTHTTLVSVRLPGRLLRELKASARGQGISLNMRIVRLLCFSIDRKEKDEWGGKYSRHFTMVDMFGELIDDAISMKPQGNFRDVFGSAAAMLIELQEHDSLALPKGKRNIVARAK